MKRIKKIPKPGFSKLTEAVAREYGQVMELVRNAVAEKIKGTQERSDRWIDLRGIWPDHAVVCLEGELYSYPYTLDADNSVLLAEPTKVVAAYQSLQEEPTEGSENTASMREAKDGSIEVTLIRSGASGNGNYYSDATLRESVPLFEGVRVFVKSDDTHTKGGGKDVRNLIGGVYDVRFIEGKTSDTGMTVGIFRPIDPSDAVVTKMTEAIKRGMQNLMGLSIDAYAKTKKTMRNGQAVREAERFTKVNSVDLIVEPGAGGGLDRLTEAATDETLTSGDKTMPLWKQRLLEAIAAKDAAKRAAINVDTIGDDDLVRLHESICGTAESGGAASAAEDARRLTEAQGDNAPVTRAEFQMLALRQAAGNKIAGAKLPQVTRDKLTAQFAAQARFTEAEVDAAIKTEGDYLSRITESGAVRVPSFGTGSIQVGDRSVLMADMMDAFFDPAHKNHRSVHSFRECYREITGDRNVTGDLRDCDMSRMAESLGDSFRESIASGTFANALGDSITRRMQALYTGNVKLDTWKKVASWGPVNDFRTVERVRIGGYGNLPAVAQGGSYDPLASPGDDKATYAATKRGGTEDVTLEAVKNDDVQAIRRIPMELSLSAKNTLYEFVFDFFRTNPVIYDTKALYHVDHANLFTGALTAAEYATHRLSMLKQTRAGSGKRLATEPATILVPFELQETAFNLFVRNQNLDKTFVQSINPEVIPVSYWTDANDWCTVADPNVLPVIEISFLDGREDPELFVQDTPNVGSLFSNDKITYKIRHIYGGAPLVDAEKGTTKAVVA